LTAFEVFGIREEINKNEDQFYKMAATKKQWKRIRGVVKRGDRVASGIAKDTPFQMGL